MSGSTVLVIDDEPRIVEFLVENLRADDYTVLIAENGTDAIEVLKKSRPNVILLDVVLPDMSGYELCRRIRSAHPVTDGWDPDVPIIMISAKVEYTDRVRGPHPGRGRLCDEAVSLPRARRPDRGRAKPRDAGA